jgi:hypothetical protein
MLAALMNDVINRLLPSGIRKARLPMLRLPALEDLRSSVAASSMLERREQPHSVGDARGDGTVSRSWISAAFSVRFGRYHQVGGSACWRAREASK